jgi:NAD-dependent SIR2 family protein deacetylase
VLPGAFCRLADLLEGRRTVVLTGAGCSTESGIPDYRTEDGRLKTPEPIRYAEFVRHERARRRYWSRSAVGWPRMARAEPNAAHRVLARLEEGRAVVGVLTQNVDGLHQRAGSRRVVELHGSLREVRCLDCGEWEPRGDVQRRLLARNPSLRDVTPAGAGRGEGVELAPDGDATVPEGAAAGFRVPSCRSCGGVLKPDVVFFGESVPPDRVEGAWELFGRGDALLVVGSSLSVWSGYRFVARAAEEGVPVGIVNLGPTRGDGDAAVRVRGRAGEVLPELADALMGSGRRSSAGSGRGPGDADPVARAEAGGR